MCQDSYITIKSRSPLVKALGKNAVPCSKNAAFGKIPDLLYEILGITCVDHMESIRCHEALHKGTHGTLNINILGVLLLYNAAVEEFEGIVYIAIYALVFKQIGKFIKPNTIGILQYDGVIKNNR
jgi:hypothetical protein